MSYQGHLPTMTSPISPRHLVFNEVTEFNFIVFYLVHHMSITNPEFLTYHFFSIKKSMLVSKGFQCGI